MDYKTIWKKNPTQAQLENSFGVSKKTKVGVCIFVSTLSVQLVILDGNHRYHVFTKELGETAMMCKLVVPMDRQGNLMTVPQLALLQGARNVQHSLTAPICMFLFF